MPFHVCTPVKRRHVQVFALLATFLLTVAVPPAAAQLSAQTAADLPADVATAWFDLQLELVRTTPGFTPPVASRAFGYSGVALYESLTAGMPGYQSLAGQLNGFAGAPAAEAERPYHWGLVANAAMAEISRMMFPNATDAGKEAISALEAETNNTLAAQTDLDTAVRSAVHGTLVARAIYDWSTTDGGHEGYLLNFPADYVRPVGLAMWVPTPRRGGNPQPAMQPYWGRNRPFALESGAECMVSAPYADGGSIAFLREVREVYDVSTALTGEQIAIAEFWADDPGQTATPPGHSISVLTQVLRQERASLATAAEAYARMGIAVADAFIGCWNAKYTYHLIRPITVIRELIDPEWMPAVDTPPFPEYPSGHSVQSGAAAEVLASLFGDEYRFTDHTHDARGMAPRTFGSFSEMAEEAAISRLYGGIHYRAAIELGLEHGRCIGRKVNALQFRAPSA